MTQNPETTVVFGVLNETSKAELRVALMPNIITRLKRSGISSLIETGVGIVTDYTDEDYEETGAKVISRDEMFAETDALGFVDRPSAGTVAKLKAGQWVTGMLGSLTDASYVATLERVGLVGIAIEKLLRKLSSAQFIDETTSQNSIMSYKAAIIAADACGPFLPTMVTAAGMIRPAKALMLGAGIAGPQVIGTLKRLGAVVTTCGVHPASQDEIEPLGAESLGLGPNFSKGQGEDGYVCALSVEEQAQQQAIVDEKAAGFDIIITTVKIPGRKPPVLFTAAGTKGLKRGAVTVDCVTSDLGGDVKGSTIGEQVAEDGAKLIGAPCLASDVTTTASNLLSRNVADILVHFVHDGKLGQDPTKKPGDALMVAGRAAVSAAAIDAERPERQGRRNIMPILVVPIALFAFALFIGVGIIGKVPATLYTPLMSGANSIHDIVIVGVVIVVVEANSPLAYVFIFLAAVLSTMSVAGGYVVIDRVLEMSGSSENEKKGESK